ncbi:RNA polymerase II elongation factor ELL2-like [Oppia nitens]|uniref:RNA polymerase II elongation factor ELL2-like n=1 Tax=Oppia nitens TaxID=1686743 RepID=UPI0023DB67E3|nr:RNA polymerase II elongation factor ELL2-like [Oppia nitens]
MATLIEGQQYALTSHLNHSVNKSLIFVKLTDSAFNAIEEYLNNKGSVSPNSKPLIEFRANDSHGVISIPSKRSTLDEDSVRFNFTLSNVDAVEPQGSFECIRQSKNRSIESFGDIDYKMQIQANDDSYQKTKVKMAVVERESKKYSTKVIKASDPNVGRKVKVKRHLTTSRPIPHTQPIKAHESLAQQCSSPPKSPIKRSIDNSSNNNNNTSLVAKKQKSLFNTNHSTTRLKTSGYNHLLNGWINKPSSPDRESNTSAYVNSNVNSNVNSSSDILLTNTSHSSPESNNAICFSQQDYHRSNPSNHFINSDNSFTKNHTRDSISRYKTNGYHNGNGSGSINSSPNSSPDSGTGSHDGSTLSSTNSYTICSNDDSPDYLTKYTKILTPDQKIQYKNDFYREYEEYRRLHQYIEGVASKFSELEIRLNTKVEGSDDWNKLMDQIVKEYEETKSCPKFQKCRKRMFYLHDKLAHIKSLVIDYDRNSHFNKNQLSHKLQVKSNPISS